MKALPWVACFGLLCALLVMRAYGDVGYAKLEAAQARVDSLQTLVDSLKAEASKADIQLVTVTDTLVITIERERVVQVVAADSVRAHTDSIGAVHLDNLVASHERHVAAVQEVADQRLLWGNTWRDYALTLEQQNAELRIATTLAYGMLRRERRNANLYKAGALLVGVALVVGAVK